MTTIRAGEMTCRPCHELLEAHQFINERLSERRPRTRRLNGGNASEARELISGERPNSLVFPSDFAAPGAKVAVGPCLRLWLGRGHLLVAGHTVMERSHLGVEGVDCLVDLRRTERPDPSPELTPFLFRRHRRRFAGTRWIFRPVDDLNLDEELSKQIQVGVAPRRVEPLMAAQSLLVLSLAFGELLRGCSIATTAPLVEDVPRDRNERRGDRSDDGNDGCCTHFLQELSTAGPRWLIDGPRAPRSS